MAACFRVLMKRRILLTAGVGKSHRRAMSLSRDAAERRLVVVRAVTATALISDTVDGNKVASQMMKISSRCLCIDYFNQILSIGSTLLGEMK